MGQRHTRICNLLRRGKYHVYTASTAQQIGALIRVEQPGLLILGSSDDAPELANAILLARSVPAGLHMAILAMAGAATPHRNGLLRMGADKVLPSSFSDGTLLASVTKLLAKKQVSARLQPDLPWAMAEDSRPFQGKA